MFLLPLFGMITTIKMKQIIFILFAIIIIGCNRNHKTSDLLGTWNCVSSTNIETEEILLPEDDDMLIAEFRPDSLYLNTEEVYGWEIKGDSILLDGVAYVYIKELTPSSLTVEIDFIGELRLTFIKIK